MAIIPRSGFPTGGIILGNVGISAALFRLGPGGFFSIVIARQGGISSETISQGSAKRSSSPRSPIRW